MKQGKVLPSQYIVGIIFFTLFLVGGISILASFRDVDDTFIDDDKFTQFNNTFNKYDTVRDKASDLQSSVVNADTDFGAFGVLNSLISSAWNTLKLIFTSFGFMTTVFGGLYSFFGIPSWIGNLIISLVSVVLVFAIFGAIFQKDV